MGNAQGKQREDQTKAPVEWFDGYKEFLRQGVGRAMYVVELDRTVYRNENGPLNHLRRCENSSGTCREGHIGKRSKSYLQAPDRDVGMRT